MTSIIVSRYIGGDSNNDKQLPGNPFSIKEGNAPLRIRQYLQDHPDTISFAQGLSLSSSPDNVDFTFSGDLTPAQIATATSVIEEYRDRVSYTAIEQLSLDEFGKVVSALEEVDFVPDKFNEDNIDAFDVPNFLGIRDSFINLYTGNWANLNVGEKRILIIDWMIPSIAEVSEIFQSPVRRARIRKLFGVRAAQVSWLQTMTDTVFVGDTYDEAKRNIAIRNILSPGLKKTQIFTSRNQAASADANSSTVEIPFFANVRETSEIIEVISDTRVEIKSNCDLEIEFWADIRVNNNGTRAKIEGFRDRAGVISNIDGNMTSEGKDGIISNYRLASFQDGDIIYFELTNGNAGNGAIVARANQSTIKISEI